MPLTNPGADARPHLLNANRDAIAIMLGRAAGCGIDIDDVVVVVVDQRDPVGRELAEAAGEKAGLDARHDGVQIAARGKIPTVIIVLGLTAARALFADGHPAVASALTRRPPHGVRSVVVAASAATSAAMLVHAQVQAIRPTGV